jgi:hypothetical protein
MNATKHTPIECAVGDMMDDRFDINGFAVAKVIAERIANGSLSDLPIDDPIAAGVEAAIEQIDEATYAFAVEAIRDKVIAEIEREAKAIALRMLRETAAKAERAAAACSPEGGL